MLKHLTCNEERQVRTFISVARTAITHDLKYKTTRIVGLAMLSLLRVTGCFSSDFEKSLSVTPWITSIHWVLLMCHTNLKLIFSSASFFISFGNAYLDHFEELLRASGCRWVCMYACRYMYMYMVMYMHTWVHVRFLRDVSSGVWGCLRNFSCLGCKIVTQRWMVP